MKKTPEWILDYFPGLSDGRSIFHSLCRIEKSSYEGYVWEFSHCCKDCGKKAPDYIIFQWKLLNK